MFDVETRKQRVLSIVYSFWGECHPGWNETIGDGFGSSGNRKGCRFFQPEGFRASIGLTQLDRTILF
jgi:hypothetical protein